jgi:hypothetical protein
MLAVNNLVVLWASFPERSPTQERRAGTPQVIEVQTNRRPTLAVSSVVLPTASMTCFGSSPSFWSVWRCQSSNAVGVSAEPASHRRHSAQAAAISRADPVTPGPGHWCP